MKYLVKHYTKTIDGSCTLGRKEDNKGDHPTWGELVFTLSSTWAVVGTAV